MIYFTPDEATRANFARINRDLARTFRHRGMSTPNTLDRQCLRYLPKLGGSHERHFAIAPPAGHRFLPACA